MSARLCTCNVRAVRDRFEVPAGERNRDVYCLPVLVAVVVCVLALLLMVRDKPRRGKVNHRPFIKTRGRRPSPRITLLFGNREFPNGLTFTPSNSTRQPQLSFRSSPVKSRYVNIPEKCHGNYTWPNVLTSADHSLKQKVPQPKKKKIINDKKIKPRVLFASQSVHEKQVGWEKDKAELILQYRLKGRDGGLIEQAKTGGLCETDPPLSSNVVESCEHVHSQSKSIYASNTKAPPDDRKVPKTRSAAGPVNSALSPELKSKVGTVFLPSYVTKREKLYQLKWDEQMEHTKPGGLCETDPPLSSNVVESCEHVHSQSKSIYASNTKAPPDDRKVPKTRSAAGPVNSALSPELKSKVGTVFLPSDHSLKQKVPQPKKKKIINEKKIKPRVLFASQSVHEKQVGSEKDKAELILQYRLKGRDGGLIEQAKTGGLYETDPPLSSNVVESCEHVHSQSKSIYASNTKAPPDDRKVPKTRSAAGPVNSALSPELKSKVGTVFLPSYVTKREKLYQLKWDEQMEHTKPGGLCETDPPLSSNVVESCEHVHSQVKSICASNTKVPLVNGQAAQNKSASTGNSVLSPELKSKVGTMCLPADVPKREKPYQVKWDEQIEQAKTGGLCETDPPLPLNGEESCKHVQSEGKSISTSNIKVPLAHGQVAQNRSARTGNSVLSPELKSKVGTMCLPADVPKREKPYQVKWDEQIEQAKTGGLCETDPPLPLNGEESCKHVQSEGKSISTSNIKVPLAHGQVAQNRSARTGNSVLSPELKSKTNGSHTDKVEHKAPRTSQKLAASHNGEVDEIELMDLSWDNSDCFSGNSAGSRESSPLELIKEVSCSSDNSISKSERKMRSPRKRAVKSHKREPVNCHCTNCDASDEGAHLSTTPSSTEKDGKSPSKEPVTCNHKNSDANDVVAQASKSEVHCILCGITLSKPQCFYSLGSLCTDDDICETTSDDINRHLVSDVDTNPPAVEGKGHPDTGYTSSEEFENESVFPKEEGSILSRKKQGTDGYDGDHESDSSLESLVLTQSSSEDEQNTLSIKEYTKQERTKRQEMAISQTIEKSLKSQLGAGHHVGNEYESDLHSNEHQLAC
ncbi:hypothetical protein AWC38_SpisGene17972 [Stylophora pistillata]|uniref:Uncharacterized protein n=1 Tax=Stylophora pistillata TaxID=50429 RepID=A0A2B4RN79_STYPI|nr:hypothetical protein AWC38_SpisGene17972 [Stylophora pistillata]